MSIDGNLYNTKRLALKPYCIGYNNIEINRVPVTYTESPKGDWGCIKNILVYIMLTIFSSIYLIL